MSEPTTAGRTGYGASAAALAAASQAGALHAADELLGDDALLESVDPRRLALLGAAVAAGVAGVNLQAVALADLAVAAWCSASRGGAVPVLGIGRPRDDPERLQAAMHTLVERALALRVEDDTERLGAQRAMVGRLAYAEPLDAGRDALHAAMRGQRQAGADIAGWVRQTDAEPCPQCVHWAAGGGWHPVDVRMKRHPQDGCYPRPVSAREVSRDRIPYAGGREPVFRARDRAAAERERRRG